MDFSLNFQLLYEIDITPGTGTQTWARIGAGISSADPSNNDSIDQTTYLDGDGYASTDVIGAQKIISFSGHRVTGDPAQDWIASVQHELGSCRKTTYRSYDKDGNKISGACTIANVDFGGGDAGGKVDIAFEVHINGKPVDTAKVTGSALTATVAGGTASGTTSFTATTDADNTLAYKLGPATFGTVYNDSYLECELAYTSGDDIPATVGQFLLMLEVNSYGRVVKVLEQELQAGDITA
jgi:hypothetical protein